MQITVKTTNGDKFTVQVENGMLVSELKAVIHSLQDIPADQQRIIYKGHVLKDEKTLESYQLEEGHTLILVKGTKKAQPAARAPVNSVPAANTQQTSAPAPAANPLASMMGNPLFSNPNNASGANFADMQRQMLENPEMMRSMMDSPMMQSLMDNPELMQSIFQSNPQIRALLERNPEMAHILNDPAVIRQSMEIARNPQLMREMMRNTDRAMSNIEAHPEGFNALRRMYENIQDPMLEASSGLGAQPSNNQTVVNPDTSASPDSATAIPNPWAPASSNSSNANSGAQASSAAPAANPFAGFGMGGAGGMDPFSMNPDQMAQMLDNPFVQQMMRNMMSNPEVMEQMISSNPMARQMMDSNPQMREMMRSPEFLQMMSNPDTMRAMLQMQSAMSRLRNPSAPAPQPQQAPSPAANANPFGNLFGFPYGGGMGSNAFGGGVGASSESLRPEILYRDQLSQLNAMGFTDATANVNALVRTGGNLEAAVNLLLGG
jgi:ubiquilin